MTRHFPASTIPGARRARIVPIVPILLLCAGLWGCGADPPPAETKAGAQAPKGEANVADAESEKDSGKDGEKDSGKDREKDGAATATDTKAADARHDGDTRRRGHRGGGYGKKPVRRSPKRATFAMSEHPPPKRTGHLMRVYRRRLTSGILQVKEEYLPTRKEARSRERELVIAGWESWPPPPAPELASTLARAHERFAECPFLLEVHEVPKDWLAGGRTWVKCVERLEELEDALEREYAIAYHTAQARPCAELANLSIAELQADALAELKERCEAMGVDLDPQNKFGTRRRQSPPKEKHSAGPRMRRQVK